MLFCVCRGTLQLLSKHRMVAYRERLLAILQQSSPQLLLAPSDSTAGLQLIHLDPDLGSAVSVIRASIRMPLLPPSSPDALTSERQSAQAQPLRSSSESRWQLRPPFWRPQGMSVAIELHGSCLNTVTSARLESSSGEVSPTRVVERPALPALLSVSSAGSERKNQQRQSWAQWLTGLVDSRPRNLLNRCDADGNSRAQQVLQLRAAVPHKEAQQFVDRLSKLSVRLRSDWAESSVELTLQMRCVWVISGEHEDALAFVNQLSPPSAPRTSDAASRAHNMSPGPDKKPLQRDDQLAASHPANDQPASAWTMRLRGPVRVLINLQQRAARAAAARLPQPTQPILSAYGAGVQYVAIVQNQHTSFEARLRLFSTLLHRRTSIDSKGQHSSIWRKLQIDAASSAPQELSKPDGVLIMLQGNGSGPFGPSPALSGFSRSASKPTQLEQLITTTTGMRLPTLVVWLGRSPWLPSIGADLTRWARSGASVVHVALLRDNAQEAAAGTFLIQHAMYQILTGGETSLLPARSKL